MGRMNERLFPDTGSASQANMCFNNVLYSVHEALILTG